MKYKIKGDSDCPIVEIGLGRDEKVRIERDSMAYMSNTMIEGKLNGNKKGLSGTLGALGRALTSGESIFVTEAVGIEDEGILGIAPSINNRQSTTEIFAS